MVELLTTEPTARAAGRRTLLAAALAAPVAMATSGCAFDVDRDYREVDAPSFKPLARKVRVAWVLGSGGPRGFVHVGVLKALDELGLAPDLIVGASVGALVGTLKAGGISACSVNFSPSKPACTTVIYAGLRGCIRGGGCYNPPLLVARIECREGRASAQRCLRRGSFCFGAGRGRPAAVDGWHHLLARISSWRVIQTSARSTHLARFNRSA